MMPENEDYILISPTTTPSQWLVMWMTYRSSGDEYVAKKVSEPYSIHEARRVAKLWAVDKLPIRGGATRPVIHRMLEQVSQVGAVEVFADVPESWEALRALSEAWAQTDMAAQLRALAYTAAVILYYQEHTLSVGEQQHKILLSHEDRLHLLVERIEACYRTISADPNSLKMLDPQAGGGVN